MTLALMQTGYPRNPYPVFNPLITSCGLFQPTVQPNVAHSDAHPSKKPVNAVQKLLEAVGLLGVGMLLHRLPVRQPGDGFKTILPADWKVWTRVLLGITAVHKINQAFDWHPSPWLGALEAVAIINPVAVGFSKNALKQTAVMAPLVAGVVQGASLIQAKIAQPLQKQWQIPPIVTQMGLTAALGLGTLMAYPRLYKRIAASGIIGKELQEKASEEATTFATTFTTCARGCSPGSFICLSELADISSSFVNWFHSQAQPKSQSVDTNQPHLQKKRTFLV